LRIAKLRFTENRRKPIRNSNSQFEIRNSQFEIPEVTDHLLDARRTCRRSSR
jgi:hypothetical protein